MNAMSPVGSPTEGEYPGPQLSTRCGLVGVEGHSKFLLCQLFDY